MPWTIERSERAACLRMDSGKVNEFSPDFFAAFHEALDELELECQPLVLASARKAFSAGLNLPLLLNYERPALALFLKDMDHLFLRLLRYPAPMIAAVEGAALAGGAILALCTDKTIARPDCRIGLTETAVGLPFPALAEAIAVLRLPRHRLREILVLGLTYTGSDLLHSGLAMELSDQPVQKALSTPWPDPRAALAVRQDLAESIVQRAQERNHLDQEFLDHWFSAPGQEALQRTVERLKRP